MWSTGWTFCHEIVSYRGCKIEVNEESPRELRVRFINDDIVGRNISVEDTSVIQ
jgi:hypothetical protein